MQSESSRPAQELWARVRIGAPDECWPYIGPINDNGYGRFRRYGHERAHRAAYAFTYGPIPAGLYVLHRCDNRPCCNPAHLFLGSKLDNSHDMFAKGRERLPFGGPDGRRKIGPAQAQDIIAKYRTGGVRQVDLASEYGISQAHVSQIVLGKQWKEAS